MATPVTLKDPIGNWANPIAKKFLYVKVNVCRYWSVFAYNIFNSPNQENFY